MDGMIPEGRLERDWATCPVCGCRRPARVLGPDGRCTDVCSVWIFGEALMRIGDLLIVLAATDFLDA